MSTWHILPTNDIDTHEESTICKCEPKLEILEDGDMMIIHNAFDGREIIELTNKIINDE